MLVRSGRGFQQERARRKRIWGNQKKKMITGELFDVYNDELVAERALLVNKLKQSMPRRKSILNRAKAG